MWNKECLFVSPHIWLFLFISPGSKAMDYSNGLFDCQSPTSPFLGGLRVLHLLEDLRGALELMDNEERDNLRCQIPDSTAEGLAEWLHGRLVKIYIPCVVLVVFAFFVFCASYLLLWFVLTVFTVLALCIFFSLEVLWLMIGAILSGDIYTYHFSFLVTLEIQMWINTQMFTLTRSQIRLQSVMIHENYSSNV